MKKNLIFPFILSILFGFSCQRNAEYTRGTGIYPGRPSENFSPELVPDNTYRNIARLSPAYQSSAYDYNLTSQLITDGIITGEMPSYINVSTNKGPVPKNEREWLLDDKPVSAMELDGTDISFQLEFGGDEPYAIEKIVLTGTLEFLERKPRGWTFICSGSDDGIAWKELIGTKGYGLPGSERPDPFAAFRPRPGTRAPGNSFIDGDSAMPKPSFTFTFQRPKPARLINTSFTFNSPVSYRMYRITLSAPCAEKWSFSALDFYSNGEKLKMLPSNKFETPG